MKWTFSISSLLKVARFRILSRCCHALRNIKNPYEKGIFNLKKNKESVLTNIIILFITFLLLPFWFCMVKNEFYLFCGIYHPYIKLVKQMENILVGFVSKTPVYKVNKVNDSVKGTVPKKKLTSNSKFNFKKNRETQTILCFNNLFCT